VPSRVGRNDSGVANAIRKGRMMSQRTEISVRDIDFEDRALIEFYAQTMLQAGAATVNGHEISLKFSASPIDFYAATEGEVELLSTALTEACYRLENDCDEVESHLIHDGSYLGARLDKYSKPTKH